MAIFDEKILKVTEYKVLDENGRLTVYEDMNDFDFKKSLGQNFTF